MSFLQQLLEDSARRYPEKVAVEDPVRGETITYQQLDELSDQLRDDLFRWGVKSSDRVGICVRKSIAGLVSIFGILKAGAAYVPVAADGHEPRNAFIIADCSAKALVVDRNVLKQLQEDSSEHDLWVSRDCAALLPYGDDMVLACRRAQHLTTPQSDLPEELAYILYTSGSTGTPKGVMHSHGSAMSFIDWCSGTFAPRKDDRISSHAPFHFDLSIFDIYVTLKHGATLVLIGEEVGKQAAHLAALIAEQRISIWYSTPSVLRLLVEYGGLQHHDYSQLRLVLFAGEVFPDRHLRALIEQWPHRRYFNLYGPTETNVCTFCEIPQQYPDDPAGPASIGKACSGTLARVMNENGRDALPGAEGELCVSGDTVMLGYWDQPDLDAKSFIVDREGKSWYRTGDLVQESDTGDYLFLGRQDRMVKRRGYRVELGEIESLLYSHPHVTEAAVIAYSGQEDSVQIKAFLCWSDDKPPSLVALKQFCGKNMPSYLMPDQFSTLQTIPKTSTDKIDYQTLLNMTKD